MPGSKNLFIAIILILLCSAPNVAAQDRTRIALSVRNVVLLPFYYAKDRQIFEKHGLYVEIVQMRSDLQMAGVASGEIDFAAAVGERHPSYPKRYAPKDRRRSVSWFSVFAGQWQRRNRS